MSSDRKKHRHPPLVPPKHIINSKGKRVMQDNDHGAVIDGRCYSYHFTKGWRNRHGRPMGFNLTRFLIDHARR